MNIRAKHIDLVSLIGRDTSLNRVASTNGGEYAGPCPFCGEGKDRFRVWPNDDKPHYWCRKCGRRGDAIQYLRDRHGYSFKQALAELGLESGRSNGMACRRVKRSLAPDPKLSRTKWEATANRVWQDAANEFVDEAVDRLWTGKSGQPGLDYLRGRGLSDAVIAAHRLGFNAREYRAEWGNVSVFIAAQSIIIPWEDSLERRSGTQWVDSTLLKVKYRSILGKRYGQAAGSADGLYGWPHLRQGKHVVLVESELCALSLWQAAPGLVLPLATGSASGGRLHRSLAALAQADRIILAFDADEQGEKAAQWWRHAFPYAVRLVPVLHDVNDMLQKGVDIVAWLKAVL